MFNPYLSGIIALIVLWLLYWILARTPNPSKLIVGADGRYSSSKIQFFLWTLVVIFAYVTVFVARVSKGNSEVISEIPANILIAMGFSATTMTVAKGITSSFATNGQVNKTQAAEASLSTIFCDDDGFPDLSKIQMLAWTLIACFMYISRLTLAMRVDPPALPDIDPAMMVLMGLGQGAYLGKKLTTTDTPRLTGVSPASGPVNTPITLSGMSFGAVPSGNMIVFNGMSDLPADTVWGDTEIKFKLPSKQPNGTDWLVGQITIGLVVGGRISANTLSFTYTI